MMKFITMALCVIGFSTAVQSQESSTPKKFLVQQDCDNPIKMTGIVVGQHGEQPLFKAQGMQVHVSGQPYMSDMMYFVNQDTGTWSLVSLYPDGTACMVAYGGDFEPYNGPNIELGKEG